LEELVELAEQDCIFQDLGTVLEALNGEGKADQEDDDDNEDQEEEL
jgi:regulator of RNase E activity RraB